MTDDQCRSSPARWVLLGCLACALAAAGCKEPPRVDVAGRVTYQGQPVPAGVVFFDPDGTQGHDGPQGYATIQDGQYDTRLTGRGVAPGPHHVRVHGFDGRPGEELPMGKMIFPEYTAPVNLSANGEATLSRDIEVPAAVGKKPARR